MSDDTTLKLEAKMMAALLANASIVTDGKQSDERLSHLAQTALRAAEALRRAAGANSL